MGVTRPWEAEIPLGAAEAARIVEDRFPGLGTFEIRTPGAGWDNTAFLVRPDADLCELVFRFPRRELAVPSITREAEVLPRLAPMLPLPIPVPEWVGAPGEDFPWLFIGHRMLRGQTADRVAPGMAQRAALAPALGRFLACLHALPAAELPLPGDELERTDFAARMREIVERLDVLQRRGLIDGPGRWLELFLSLRYDPRPDAHRIVHGDLYASHLLLDDESHLASVIDWGDVHLGDRAVDLAVMFAFLPAAARPAFIAAYGEIDARTLHTARLRAAYHSIAEAWYGSEQNDADVMREGRLGMELVLEP